MVGVLPAVQLAACLFVSFTSFILVRLQAIAVGSSRGCSDLQAEHTVWSLGSSVLRGNRQLKIRFFHFVAKLISTLK